MKTRGKIRTRASAGCCVLGRCSGRGEQPVGDLAQQFAEGGIIGATLAIGAFTDLLFEGRTQRVFVGSALGLPAVALGWAMRRLAPASLSILGGWILLFGAGVHVTGILTTESELGLEWLTCTMPGP